MKTRRSWISLVGFCAGAALVSGLFIAIVVAAGSLALASGQNEPAPAPAPAQTNTLPQTSGTEFTGMITDSYCGSRHKRNSGMGPAECVRACVRRGASYVLVNGDTSYILIGNDTELQHFAGQRANVWGTRQEDTIFVNSAKTLF